MCIGINARITIYVEDHPDNFCLSLVRVGSVIWKVLAFEALFHDVYFFMIFLCRLLAFFKIYFKKKTLSQTLSECQTVWIQIKTEILSVLIWV